MKAPILVARRFDGLGGRLNAITNAHAIASELDLDFRFVWPRQSGSGQPDPTELFDQDYLARHEVTPDYLAGWTPVPYETFDPTGMGLSSFVDMTHPMEVAAVPGDDRDSARARFVRSFRGLGWSAAVRSLMSSCSDWNPPPVALHLRAGDIVSGGWRQIMHHEKYTPLPYAEHAAKLFSRDGGRLLLLSDNPDCVDYFQTRFPAIVVASSLIPEYGELASNQKALAEILLMSRCQVVTGAAHSAFSCLAANLGGIEIVAAERLVPAGQHATLLSSSIGRRGRDPLGKVRARDVGWYVDVFGDEIPHRDRLRVVSKGLRLDRDFAAMYARRARWAAVDGDFRAARRAGGRADRLTASSRIHDDPKVEALASNVVVDCLHSIAAKRRRSAAEPLERAARNIERCSGLSTHQMHRNEVAASLRFLFGLAERLATADAAWRDLVYSHVLCSGDRLAISDFRPPGLDRHAEVVLYDPVSRDLEWIAIMLSVATGEALTAIAAETTALRQASLQRISVTHTGTRWIETAVPLETESMTMVVGRLPGEAGCFAASGLTAPAGRGVVVARIPVPDIGHIADDALRSFDVWTLEIPGLDRHNSL